MSADLTTAADLAAEFRITEEKLHELRRRHGWPCVKLGRFDVRFTEAQVEQIVRMMTVEPTREATPAKVPGQTARSAARRRTA